MVMITSLFVAALAGIASAAPTNYYGASSSSSSSGCGSSGCEAPSSSGSSCGSSGCDSAPEMQMDSSSSMMIESTSTMMMESTSTMMMEATSTMAAAMSQETSSYNMPMYGSGSSSYGSSGYDSCVQQCVAQFGQPTSMGGTYQQSNSSSSSGSSGSSGNVHTVIVAPMKGVLRYVPFAVNASVGDTIEFHWNAGPHTVTKSSVLDVCNKTDDQAFTSGVQNASFTFTQVVNDTNATFFYCGVPGHCQKGMFGVLNPPNAGASPMTVGNMMATLASNNSVTAAAWSATMNATGAAATWGESMDLSGMPGWAQNAMVENVLYTRAIMAANPNAVNAAGNLDLSMIDPAKLMVTPDVAAAAASSSATTGSSTAASGSANSPAAANQTNNANTPSGASTSGAGAIASPRVVVAVVAVAAAFFAL